MFIWPKKGKMAGCCKHDCEPSVTISSVEICNELRAGKLSVRTSWKQLDSRRLYLEKQEGGYHVGD